MKGALQRRRRSSGVPVPRWYPGRGSAFHAPPAGVFYSTKVRARLDWWRHNNASSSVIRALQVGVKLEFTAGPPRPLRTSPILVQDQDVAFMLEDLAKGDRLELPVDTGRRGYMICVPINIGCCWRLPAPHLRCDRLPRTRSRPCPAGREAAHYPQFSSRQCCLSQVFVPLRGNKRLACSTAP